MNTKLELLSHDMKTLTRDVQKHNNFAERMPKVEERVAIIEERQKTANHRIDDLEKG